MISFSIIIPVYKVELYIERCLRSVMAQDYTGPIECILVDDCGGDRSMDIARDMIASYHGSINFRELKHKSNGGLSAARNTGIDHATGDYLFFLDSDDEVMPYTISMAAELIQKYPGVDLIAGSHTDVSPDHEKLIPFLKREVYLHDTPELTRLIWFFLIANISNKVIRRDLFVDKRLYFPEGLLHEDEQFRYFLGEITNSMVVTEKPLYRYYTSNSGSIMNQPSPRHIEDCQKIAMNVMHSGGKCFKAVWATHLLYRTWNHAEPFGSKYYKTMFAFSRDIIKSTFARGHVLMGLFLVLFYLVTKTLYHPVWKYRFMGYVYGVPGYIARKVGSNLTKPW